MKTLRNYNNSSGMRPSECQQVLKSLKQHTAHGEINPTNK